MTAPTPDDPDRVFTAEQRVSIRTLRSQHGGEADELYRLYSVASAELNRALADAGYLPKREAEVTIRIEILAEVDEEAL